MPFESFQDILKNKTWNFPPSTAKCVSSPNKYWKIKCMYKKKNNTSQSTGVNPRNVGNPWTEEKIHKVGS